MTNNIGNSNNNRMLDYGKWRRHILDRFKKVALRKNVNEESEVVKHLVKRVDLDLSKINIYLHKVLNLALTGTNNNFDTFKLRIYYGNIADDGSF